jgi:YD repeat-containing protein
MARPDRIEGLAIVSADGMIADKDGIQPDALLLEADQRFFRQMLAMAAAVVHGRNSGEGGADAARRHRLILTHRINGLAPDPETANAILWNPAGASLEEAWGALGLSGGRLLVIGGTDAFGHFLEYGYDAFHLSSAAQARLPGGRPLFPGIPPHTAEAMLSRHGLKPGPPRVLDQAKELTLKTWIR